jgi:hypothetical protein
MVLCLVHNKFQRLKGAVVIKCEVPSWSLASGIEKSNEKSQVGCSLGSYLAWNSQIQKELANFCTGTFSPFRV